MRRFRSIIESAYPVPIDSLWVKDKKLKVFTKGEWVTIGGDILPAATKTSMGGVKAGTNIAALAEDADLATVVGTVNSILTQLKSAGVLI